eukprot:CAMPEP_0117020352 /NCGR_PEP_ID=MMETSP0472-20121206/15487_1 /TAXON_ID=693140 ORGANISM="Tiarina fusus, Strain LIS" /NCGR_SAMPLE_ID=MMETSP0472 /ASSEMBLY_ACC=CAM_ASM_000603 /LENGTH=303 /DNA_ID=CAMNT_0004725545 /DNA_START=53 /DNA_END=964 /DNA_ORIENTATION=-
MFSFFLLSVSFLAFTGTTSALVPSLPKLSVKQGYTTSNKIRTPTAVGYAKREDAEPLQLSTFDIERFAELKTRGTTMPIVILDSVLPGQTLFFKSSDPKFDELITYALSSQNEESEIGILGFNPHTGQPLNMGVTARIKKKDVIFGLTREKERIIATSFTGQRRFEVVGEPWMDNTQSFWLANVEVVDKRHEILPEELEDAAMELYDKIPGMVQEFVDWVLKTERLKPQELNTRLKEMGPLPEDVTKRAMWIGALVNPVPSLEVCMEIRPAMLACRNIHDRMVLATTALRASIDHMSGKRKLF